MNSLQNKTTLLTGASRGVGKGIAHRGFFFFPIDSPP